MSEQGPRVLVIDDERPIRRLLRSVLSAHGYAVHEAATGGEALQQVRIVRPDLIILDLGLPDVDGIEVARSLRRWVQIPIIALSVRESESDKISMLDAGADDYLTKPFGAGELLARIRAALRRVSRGEEGPVLSAGELRVDLSRREVRAAERSVQLTPTEYELLKVLISNSGKVLTHRQLVDEVWGGLHYEDALHLLRVNISNLRHKLEAGAGRFRYIVTEPGVGYRLRAADISSSGSAAS
ncbi:MAG TPA: response regulator transcription factor [Bryobacteraceae bacterium]|nr:response regulator transcription factor [Bryobacteraceae bacterium]